MRDFRQDKDYIETKQLLESYFSSSDTEDEQVDLNGETADTGETILSYPYYLIIEPEPNLKVTPNVMYMAHALMETFRICSRISEPLVVDRNTVFGECISEKLYYIEQGDGLPSYWSWLTPEEMKNTTLTEYDVYYCVGFELKDKPNLLRPAVLKKMSYAFNRVLNMKFDRKLSICNVIL